MSDIVQDGTFSIPGTSTSPISPWSYSGDFIRYNYSKAGMPEPSTQLLYLGARLGTTIDIVSQYLPTSQGQYYQVTFNLYIQYYEDRNEKTHFTCSCGTNSVLITNQDAPSQVWRTYSFIFQPIAGETSSNLVFTSYVTIGRAFNVLQSVTCVPCSAPTQLTPSAPTNLSSSSNVITFTNPPSNGSNIIDYAYSTDGSTWYNLNITPIVVNTYIRSTWPDIYNSNPYVRSPLTIPLPVGTYNTVMIRAINSAGAGSSATLNSPMTVSVVNNGYFSYMYNNWIRNPTEPLNLSYEGVSSGYAVFMRNSNLDDPSILGQRLITQIGVTYTFSFWLNVHGILTHLRCECDNITLLTLNNAATYLTYYSVTFTATSTSSLLKFYSTTTGYNIISDVNCYIAGTSEPTLPGPATITSISPINGIALVSFTQISLPTITQSFSYQYLEYASTADWPAPIPCTGLTSPISISIPGLTPGILYEIKLLAVNSLGSSKASRSMGVMFSAPNNPVITSVSSGVSSASVSFAQSNISNVTGFKYQYQTSSDSGVTWSTWSTATSVTGLNSPITISGLTPGTMYKIGILAVNSLGSSALSNTMNVQIPIPVAPTVTAPTVTSVTSAQNSAIINYIPPTNLNGSTVTGYYYAYSNNSGQTWSTPTLIQGTTSPLTIPGLNVGISHIFKIAAVVQINGTEVISQYSTINPLQTAIPYSLGSLSLSVNGGNITVTSDSSIGAASSIINYQWSYDSVTWTPMNPPKVACPFIISLPSSLIGGQVYTIYIQSVTSVSTGPIASVTLSYPSVTIVAGTGGVATISNPPPIVPGSVDQAIQVLVLTGGTSSTLTDGSLMGLTNLISLDLGGSPDIGIIPPNLCLGNTSLIEVIMPINTPLVMGDNSFANTGLIDFLI